MGEVVTGSGADWVNHWGKAVLSEAMRRGGSTETLLALENSWERVDDTLGRILLSAESLARRRPTKVMGGRLGGGEGNKNETETLVGLSCDLRLTEPSEV